MTPASGRPSPALFVDLDDFNVSLRDSSGEYRSFKRTPGFEGRQERSLQAHDELLDKITDKNIHDVVAYLETLK